MARARVRVGVGASAVSPTVPRPCTSTWPHVSSDSALGQPPVKDPSSALWPPADVWLERSASFECHALVRREASRPGTPEAKAPSFCLDLGGRQASRRVLSSKGSSHLIRREGGARVRAGVWA